MVLSNQISIHLSELSVSKLDLSMEKSHLTLVECVWEITNDNMAIGCANASPRRKSDFDLETMTVSCSLKIEELIFLHLHLIEFVIVNLHDGIVVKHHDFTP